MALEITQIREILDGKPGLKKLKGDAISQESRIRLHSEISLSRADTSAITEYLNWVKTLVKEPDKYAYFLSLFRLPVQTVGLTQEIYQALSRIFDGKNPVFRYNFRVPEDEQDWRSYRVNKLKGVERWKTEGWELMQNDINSIVIVDLPVEQEGELPEPYYYFLKFNEVVDFNLTGEKEIDWIMFKQTNNRLAVFCDGWFRVFRLKEGTSNEIEGEPLFENEHELGYCPAKFFWTSPVSRRKFVVKKSPISPYLGDLDKLLFYSVGNDHLQLYARWPILSGFAADCDFEDRKTGMHCDGGYLRNSNHEYILQLVGNDRMLKPCPVCAKSRLDGPGTFIEIDPPNRENEMADLRNPITVTKIDRDSLEYNNEDVERRKLEIFSKVTGYKGMPINDKAVNKEQVFAIFESQEGALKFPQDNFEIIMQWTDSTVGLLRYGEERFLGASISLGTEHYIGSAEEYLELYKNAKSAKLSVIVLDSLEDQYLETKYKNNEEELRRAIIMVNIDPFRHLSNEEVRLMFTNNQIKYEDYLLKINLGSLVKRFERENIDIVKFGMGIEFDKKVKKIVEVMKGYVKEMKPEVVADPVGSN